MNPSLIRILAGVDADTDRPQVLHYQLLRQLGEGGMGIVLEAFDTRLSRKVAIKIIKPEMARRNGASDRFVQEARAMAAIRHPHVITIHAVEDSTPLPMIVMDLLEGETLQDRLVRGQTLPTRKVIRITQQIGEGLRAAHRRKILHRDIKPANIWLAEKTDEVTLLDFGLAETIESGARVGFAGTPAYLAPEQAFAQPLDERTDLHAVGVLMFRMLSGRLPRQAATPQAMLVALVSEPAAPLQSIDARHSPLVVDLVNDLTCSRPAGRPDSAQILLERLDELQDELDAGWVSRSAAVAKLPITWVYAASALLPALLAFAVLNSASGLAGSRERRPANAPPPQHRPTLVTPGGSGTIADAPDERPPTERRDLSPIRQITTSSTKQHDSSDDQSRNQTEIGPHRIWLSFDLTNLPPSQIVDAALSLPRLPIPVPSSQPPILWGVTDPVRADLSDVATEEPSQDRDGLLVRLEMIDAGSSGIDPLISDEGNRLVAGRTFVDFVSGRAGSEIGFLLTAHEPWNEISEMAMLSLEVRAPSDDPQSSQDQEGRDEKVAR